MTANEDILRIAIGYLGKDEEPGNRGWYDKAFEKKMIARGWKPSEAWCAYFGELVWMEAYAKEPVIQHDINHLFSGSAVETFRNFSREADWKADRDPEPGALAVFQRYREGSPHWSGHMAIVETAINGVLCTIDGNTNPAGGREGYTVARIKRVINFNPIKNGIVLLGFIHPQQIKR
jgi:hypothetical protein